MEEIIFPNQIRMYRRVRGRSMQELADFLGVSLSAVSKIEKGYRRIDQEQLVRIAEFLDCPLQDIFVNEASSQPDVVQAWRREQERRNRVNERSGLKMLGAGLRYIRGQKNLTLADVADGAELTLSVYHRIEMGQREVSEDEISRIARALGYTNEELQKQIYDWTKRALWTNSFSATMRVIAPCRVSSRDIPICPYPKRAQKPNGRTLFCPCTVSLPKAEWWRSIARRLWGRFRVWRAWSTACPLMRFRCARAVWAICCRRVPCWSSIRRKWSAWAIWR